MKRRDEPDETCGTSGSTGARAPLRRRRTVGTLLVAGLCLTFGSAHADVPTAGDIAACNREAREELRSRSTSPTAKDTTGADAARKGRGATGTVPGATGHITQSPDPQIHGMDGEGAKDPAYRAVYRVCMRKKGF